MKKSVKILVFATLLSAFGCISAQTAGQDVVYCKNGTVIRGVIIEQENKNLVKIETVEGNLFVYSADEVDKITKEKPKSSVLMRPNDLSQLPKEAICLAGEQDAKIYYEGDGSLVGLTTGVSLLTGPVMGLLPPIAVSTTSLNDSELNYPSHALWQNTDYKTCYTEKAQKIRRKKAWTAYGISSGVHLVALFAVYSMVIGVALGSISSGL